MQGMHGLLQLHDILGLLPYLLRLILPLMHNLLEHLIWIWSGLMRRPGTIKCLRMVLIKFHDSTSGSTRLQSVATGSLVSLSLQDV